MTKTKQNNYEALWKSLKMQTEHAVNRVQKDCSNMPEVVYTKEFLTQIFQCILDKMNAMEKDDST